MWIKSFEANSPKNYSTKNVNLNCNAFRPGNKNNERVRPRANYKENMKTLIHQKYMKKIEDLQRKHEKEMGKQRKDFAGEIEDMTMLNSIMANEMISVKMDAAMKCRCKNEIKRKLIF